MWVELVRERLLVTLLAGTLALVLVWQGASAVQDQMADVAGALTAPVQRGGF